MHECFIYFIYTNVYEYTVVFSNTVILLTGQFISQRPLSIILTSNNLAYFKQRQFGKLSNLEGIQASYRDVIVIGCRYTMYSKYAYWRCICVAFVTVKYLPSFEYKSKYKTITANSANMIDIYVRIKNNIYLVFSIILTPT